MFPLARVLVAVVLAAPLAAQGTKLNGPLARGIIGSIGPYVSTSPDGERHVYSADREEDGVAELWAVASSGKEAPLLLAVNVGSYGSITPDGKRVLHPVGDDLFGVRELAVVPIDASAPSRSLTGPLPAHAVLSQYATSADGAHLVYLVDQETDEAFELYGAPLEDGTPVKLNGALVPGGSVRGFVLARAGALVLYLADQDADEVTELFVVPADGSQPARKLPIPLVPGGSVGFFELDADATHAIYTADQEEDERFELYTVPTDGGGAPLRLSAQLVPDGDVGAGYANSIVFPTWDRSRVLYSADQDTDELFELFSVPTDGSGAPVKLCTLSDQGLQLAGLSYDSGWVLLRNDALSTPVVDLFSVPVDGSGPLRRISGAIPGGGVSFMQVSLDSRHVVYVADQETDRVQELYSVPIDGNAPPLKLSAPMPPGGNVNVDFRTLLPGFWVMAEGVMYEADQEVDGLNELFFAPIGGGAPARKLASGPVSSAFPSYTSFQAGQPPSDSGQVLFQRDKALWSVSAAPGADPVQLDQPDFGGIQGDVELFRTTADGARVVYRALEEGDRVPELYSVPPEKPSLKVQLLPDLQAVDRIASVELAANDRRLVFLAELAPSTSMQLYSLPVEGGEAPRLLGPVLGPQDFVRAFWLAPGGQSVLLEATRAGLRELHAASVDGGAPAVFLALAQETVVDPRFDPGASRVVFRQSNGLYAVPLDGSAPAVRVNPVQRQSEGDYQVTPDGSLVVFRSPAATQRSELFVTPIDGSALPRRVSDAMPAQGDLTGFALAADGTRAVYRADPFVNDRFELFSVPLDGSAPPVRLHPAFATNRDVEAFAIAADDQHVVYLVDAAADAKLELFSVPLDGSRSPVRISRDLPAGGGVFDFRISPDAQRVVYRARLGGFQGMVLFSTPIRSARGGVRLSPDLGGGSVGSFQISADSSTVAFHASRPVLNASLFAVPIASHEKATELVGPFLGTVHDFAISADGSRLTWRADQDVPGAVDLYSAPYQDGTKALRRRGATMSTALRPPWRIL